MSKDTKRYVIKYKYVGYYNTGSSPQVLDFDSLDDALSELLALTSDGRTKVTLTINKSAAA